MSPSLRWIPHRAVKVRHLHRTMRDPSEGGCRVWSPFASGDAGRKLPNNRFVGLLFPCQNTVPQTPVSLDVKVYNKAIDLRVELCAWNYIQLLLLTASTQPRHHYRRLRLGLLVSYLIACLSVYLETIHQHCCVKLNAKAKVREHHSAPASDVVL